MPSAVKFSLCRRAGCRLRRLLALWRAAACAAALALAAAAPAAAAGRNGAPAAASVPPPARAQSFYGAYLAGTYAADTGSPLAVPYLRRALAFRPDDAVTRRELLLSLIDAGDYNAAVSLAAGLGGDNDAAIAPMAQLILAANAIKQKRYKNVGQLVRRPGENEAQSLLWVFMTAWADYGRGRKNIALRNLSQAGFSEWYSFLSAYNTALIEDLSGNRRQAARAYQAAAAYGRLAQMAPEAYAHMIWAYTAFLQRTQGKDAALAALDRAEAIVNGENLVFSALRDNLQNKRSIPRLVQTPAQGASEFAYDIGSAFLRAGEDLYADVYLQTAVYLRPDNDAALFRLGVLATRAGQPAKARLFFSRLPQNSLYYPDMQLLAALSINQDLSKASDAAKKRNKQAAAGLEAIIAKARDKTPLENVLANIYLQTEDYPAAVKILNGLISRVKQPQEQDWSIYFQRAIAYERLKDWPKAEADFRQTLKLNPNSADALNYYGYSLAERGQNLEYALDLVRKAARIDPKSGAIIDSLGWVYYKMGRYDEALPILEKAVRLEAGDSSINEHLGDVYWRAGRRLQAVFQWNHALAYGPATPEDAARIRDKLRHGLPDIAPAPARPAADKAAAEADKEILDDNPAAGGDDGDDNDEDLAP